MPMIGKIRTDNDFIYEVKKMIADGWNDADYMARQIVDDHYRHTGMSLHRSQHIVEKMVESVMRDEHSCGWTVRQYIPIFRLPPIIDDDDYGPGIWDGDLGP